jgi:hypothetical protein
MQLSRRSALFATGLGLLAPPVALAQTAAIVTREAVQRYLSELDNLAVETLKQTGVPGLSIAVVSQDRSSTSKASA